MTCTSFLLRLVCGAFGRKQPVLSKWERYLPVGCQRSEHSIDATTPLDFDLTVCCLAMNPAGGTQDEMLSSDERFMDLPMDVSLVDADFSSEMSVTPHLEFVCRKLAVQDAIDDGSTWNLDRFCDDHAFTDQYVSVLLVFSFMGYRPGCCESPSVLPRVGLENRIRSPLGEGFVHGLDQRLEQMAQRCSSPS